jgi:hypothetical protein
LVKVKAVDMAFMKFFIEPSGSCWMLRLTACFDRAEYDRLAGLIDTAPGA